LFSFLFVNAFLKNTIKIATLKRKTQPPPPSPKPTTPACFRAGHYELPAYFLQPFADDLDS